jgi:hypothetical protein
MEIKIGVRLLQAIFGGLVGGTEKKSKVSKLE